MNDRIGLCETCGHAKVIRSDRGSTFYQCRLSFTNPDFPKYPRLPVLACRGFEPAAVQPVLPARSPK